MCAFYFAPVILHTVVIFFRQSSRLFYDFNIIRFYSLSSIGWKKLYFASVNILSNNISHYKINESSSSIPLLTYMILRRVEGFIK